VAKNLSFRAAVFEGTGAPLRLQELAVSGEPQRGEVLVRVKASGVCHSDYRVFKGDWSAPTPLVLGHEGAGVVESVGPDVTRVKPGDHVVLTWTPPCGQCRYCVVGRPALCDVAKSRASRHVMPDGTTRLRRGEEPVHSYISLGTFGECALVTQSAVVPIRKDVPFTQACLVGCAVTTGIGAVINTAKVEPGATVLLLGCGGVGLSILQGARIAAAEPIIAVDPNQEKLATAKRFGATHVVNPDEDPDLQSVLEITGGRGVDYAFEAVGLASTAELAFAMTAKGGTAVLVGEPASGTRISIDPLLLADQERTLKGSNYGSSVPLRDFPRILDWYASGRIDLDAMVTDRIPLEGVNEAFAAMGRGEGIRTVIEHS